MSGHDEREDYDDEPLPFLVPERIARWPANVMWTFGLLQLIFTQVIAVLLATVTIFTRLVDDNLTLGEFWEQMKGDAAFWATLAAWPVATVCSILVMRAANNLRGFRRYWLVVIGALVILLSFPFIYLAVFQMPLGLWLLVLLARRDVRARFEAVARGRINQSPPHPE